MVRLNLICYLIYLIERISNIVLNGNNVLCKIPDLFSLLAKEVGAPHRGDQVRGVDVARRVPHHALHSMNK
jgi:hypothetical protein